MAKHKKEHKKEHKGMMQKVKAEARSIRNEATIQATQASSFGQLWKNYIDAINRAVDEWKQARREKKAKGKEKDERR